MPMAICLAKIHGSLTFLPPPLPLLPATCDPPALPPVLPPAPPPPLIRAPFPHQGHVGEGQLQDAAIPRVAHIHPVPRPHHLVRELGINLNPPHLLACGEMHEEGGGWVRHGVSKGCMTGPEKVGELQPCLNYSASATPLCTAGADEVDVHVSPLSPR